MSNWLAAEFTKLKEWLEKEFTSTKSRVNALEERVVELEARFAGKL